MERVVAVGPYIIRGEVKPRRSVVGVKGRRSENGVPAIKLYCTHRALSIQPHQKRQQQTARS